MIFALAEEHIFWFWILLVCLGSKQVKCSNTPLKERVLWTPLHAYMLYFSYFSHIWYRDAHQNRKCLLWKSTNLLKNTTLTTGSIQNIWNDVQGWTISSKSFSMMWLRLKNLFNNSFDWNFLFFLSMMYEIQRIIQNL